MVRSSLIPVVFMDDRGEKIRIVFQYVDFCCRAWRTAFAHILRRGYSASICLLVGMFLLPSSLFAVSCTSQSELSDTESATLVASVRTFGVLLQAGNVAALKNATIPSVAAQFEPIAGQVAEIAPLIGQASLTVVNLYRLDATDLKAPEDDTEFYCGAPNSPEVVFSLPRIPPGEYAIAIVHATGVAQPQQFTLLLARDAASAPSTSGTQAPWKLAGLSTGPLQAAGKDGLWYWTHARTYTQSKQNWNAYFYYQTAIVLLAPVNFMTSPNLDKLLKERNAVAPPGLPGEQPMVISTNGHSYSVTDLHTDGSLGGLDLVIAYQSQDNSDPVATRTRNVELMHAVLDQHPELRQGFHGLWVYANAANQRPFANELPVSQIP